MRTRSLLFSSLTAISSVLATPVSAPSASSNLRYPTYKILTFTIGGTTNGTTVPVSLLLSDPSTASYLLTSSPQGSPTQALFSTQEGEGTIQTLSFLLPDDTTLAGATAPDVGHAYGNVGPVKAAGGETGEAAWSFDKGTGRVYHTLTATENTFFACDVSIQDEQRGEKIKVLSWGEPQYSGEAPVGCERTDVFVSTL